MLQLQSRPSRASARGNGGHGARRPPASRRAGARGEGKAGEKRISIAGNISGAPKTTRRYVKLVVSWGRKRCKNDISLSLSLPSLVYADGDVAIRLSGMPSSLEVESGVARSANCARRRAPFEAQARRTTGRAAGRGRRRDTPSKRCFLLSISSSRRRMDRAEFRRPHKSTNKQTATKKAPRSIPRSIAPSDFRTRPRLAIRAECRTDQAIAIDDGGGGGGGDGDKARGRPVAIGLTPLPPLSLSLFSSLSVAPGCQVGRSEVRACQGTALGEGRTTARRCRSEGGGHISSAVNTVSSRDSKPNIRN